ncbi:unnamed protein product [Prorocentrum cordatum]|nr:unnamed protein product [Polarella glacialis]
MDDRRIDLGILTTDVYKSLDEFDVDFTHVWKKYARVARDIEDYEGVEGLSGQIIRSMYIKGASLTARLAKTCKTHKNPVTFRALHCSAQYSFAGLSKWVSGVLRRHLSDLPWLVRDAVDAARHLRGRHAAPGTRLAKIDIKDYFMSGSMDELIQDATSHMTGAQKALVQRALQLLLAHQYVSSPHWPNHRHQVVVGSGMGLIHSGEVADVALANRLESWACSQYVRMHFQVSVYMRFKDDILIAYRDFAKFSAFLRIMQHRSRYFRLVLDEGHVKESHWLQLSVCIAGGAFSVKPAFKITTLTIPLASTSAHPWSVHRSWPRAMLQTMLAFCSHTSQEKDVKLEFRNRLTNACFNSSLLEGIFPRSPPRPRETCTPVWLILPFHPHWCKLIAKAVSVFNSNPFFQRMLGESGLQVSPVRVAWRSYLPSLRGRMASDRARKINNLNEIFRTEYGFHGGWLGR